MLRNFNFSFSSFFKTPVKAAQTGLAVLGVLNLIALYFVFFTPGGSPAQLEEQITDLRARILQRALMLKQTRVNVSRIERGRTEGDQFLANYFLTLRTASSTLLDELSRAAKESKITPKEHSIQTEDIEGSDTLKMMSIVGNYEGTYADLIEYINRMDRSSRLLIIESLTASPQQGKGLLNINMKMDTFVREDGVQ